MESGHVYSLGKLYTLGWSERLEKLIEQGRVKRDVMEDATNVIDVDTACKMSENVVGVYGLPLSFVPDIPINGEYVTLPFVTEEPSVVAAVSKASKILRGTNKGIISKCGDTIAHGMAQLILDKDLISHNIQSCSGKDNTFDGDDDASFKEKVSACWDQIREFIKDDSIIEKLNSDHPLLVKNGGGCKKINLINIKELEGYLDVSVNVVDAMGANSVSRFSSKIAGIIKDKFPFVRPLACIVINTDDERYVEVESFIPVLSYANTMSCDQSFARKLLKDVALLSNFAKECPSRCYTHNKGIMNGVEAISLALGQDTRAILMSNAALMHKTGIVQPLIHHEFDEINDQLHSKGMVQVPIGTVGGCLKNQKQANALIKSIGDTKQVMMSIGSVGLCSNLAALIMLCSPGGLETGHIPLTKK